MSIQYGYYLPLGSVYDSVRYLSITAKMTGFGAAAEQKQDKNGVPFLGYLPSERKQPVVNRAKDAVRDDHAVMALRKHTSDLLKLKDLVEQVIQAR
jgi:hypothetical protein